MGRKKHLQVDKRADREINKFPKEVVFKFYALFEILAEKGRLKEPDAKKLKGKHNLYELRVRYKGQWRSIYAYVRQDIIVILCAFRKKTQKTSSKYIDTALGRLKHYI